MAKQAIMALHSFRKTIYPSLWVLIVLLTGTLSVSAAGDRQQDDGAWTVVETSLDAYVAYNAETTTWEIGTAGIRRRMNYDSGVGYRLTRFTNKITGREWLAPGSGTSAELNMVLGGKAITGSAQDFKFKRYAVRRNGDKSLELVVSLAHGQMIVHLHYVAFPGTAIIEQWAAIENTGAIPLLELTQLDSISVGLRPSPDALTLYWIQGLSPDDASKNLDQPEAVLRFKSNRLDRGKTQTIGSQGRSSEDTMGWFALYSTTLREGIFGGIEWSGDWQLCAANDGAQTLLQAGLKGIRHTIAPGEIFQAPRRFIGFFSGDLDEAANQSHLFARRYLVRPRPADFPWTQFNTWFAYYTKLDENILRQEVDAAAELGLEVFVLDAGWYEKSPLHGDFGYGLGTWRENREKFPSGIAAFADYVHNKGMKFGLWVEPERVDLDAVELGKDIERDWLSPGTDWVAPPPPGTARSAMLCLNKRGAREWVKTWLTRIIREYKVDWLKWDNNVWRSCNPPGETGDADYLHVQGLYEILDYLHQEFPNLVIEDCASGGNRLDYALMRHTDIAWLSDETDPSYRVRYHVAGASYPFPSEYLNAWLVESWFEHLADVQNNPGLLRMWLRSRMMGAFGFSVTLRDWTPDFRAIVKNEIKQYKDIRGIIANGMRYQLLPQNDMDANVEPPNEPDATEFYDPVTGNGVVFLFHGKVRWANRRVLLKGLEPTATYSLTSLDGNLTLRQTGAQLMRTPLRLTFAEDLPSTLLLIKMISPPRIPQWSIER